MTLKARELNKIIVHCSDTMDGTVEAIRRYHTKQKGWDDIGYHYVIYKDGSVNPGRPLDVVGAHAQGHNNDSIGICLIGHARVDMNNLQFDALLDLINALKLCFGPMTIHPHNEFNKAKTCPGFDVKVILDAREVLRKSAQKTQTT